MLRFQAVEIAARTRLRRLEAATSLKDLAAIPGNQLEALKRDRKGQYSIRINDQWRIAFAGETATRTTSRLSIIIENGSHG